MMSSFWTSVIGWETGSAKPSMLRDIPGKKERMLETGSEHRYSRVGEMFKKYVFREGGITVGAGFT